MNIDILRARTPHPVFAMAGPGDDGIRALEDEMVKLNERAISIETKVRNAGREFTPVERAELDLIFAEFEQVETQLKVTKNLARSTGRKTAPNMPRDGIGVFAAPGSPGLIAQPDNRGLPRGFNHYGEIWQAVKESGRRGGTIDPRLIYDAPTTYSSEGVGADGGFLVPPQWSRDVMQVVTGEESLLGRCNVVPVTGNSYCQVKDEGPPWATTGGVQAYWEGEAGQITQSKVALKTALTRLRKLTALVPVTEELLEDAPSLDAYLRRKVASIFDFKVKLAILQGNGTTQPFGILNSPCLISIAKELGQEADTIVTENINKMWARLAPGSEDRAVWLFHKDNTPQLYILTVGVGVGGVPVFIPAGGLSAKPYDSLMGRPILYTQACETLGDKGDLVLADLSQYQVILKTGGLRTDVSMHLWFDYDVLAYRFILRIDGASLWSAAVAARDGNSTYSPFITLDERA